MHIREPEEIDKFKAQLPAGIRCTTILVTREEAMKKWGNKADDNVGDYHYDHVFFNDAPTEVSGKAFVELINSILEGTVGCV